MATYPVTSSDYAFFLDTYAPSVLHLASRSESANFEDSYVASLTPGGVVAEGFKIVESFALMVRRNAVMAERFTMAQRLALFQFAAIIENMDVTGTASAWFALMLRENFNLSSLWATANHYNVTISQIISLVEALDRAAHLSLSEHLSVTNPPPVYQFTANSLIMETLALSVSLSKQLVMRVALTESVDLEDVEILQMLYNQTMVEDICMEILYQSPNSNITTWAINTRTNAVTEYQNFAFNSYATMGNKYLAADANGIYELNGDQDLTTPIMAKFGGGYFAPNSMKFAGLKGVYLAVRGQGNYLLKLITGDGSERIYRCYSNPDRIASKVNIGKGIRARYMTWELSNENGQDFDFDQIEFVPMMSGRRV